MVQHISATDLVRCDGTRLKHLAEAGLAWLDQIFLPQTAVEDQYRLLLIDGHRSHATFEFMWKCYENKVVVFYLLPHSSHVL